MESVLNLILKERKKEVIKLLEHEMLDSAFVIAILGVEFIGALFDDKPLRAEKQSSKRFKKGLRKGFPKFYGNPVIVEFLFKSVRCNVTHLGLGGNSVVFVNKHEEHLMLVNNTLLIHKATFCGDYVQALNKVLRRIKEGELKEKKGL